MENIQKLKKNISKNLVYFVISIVLLAFFVISINFERFGKIFGILDEISFVNNHLKQNIPENIPYSYNFIQGESEIQAKNQGLSKSFENKVKNFLANIFSLGGNFDSAKENVSDDDRMFYFNKGNIQLFDAYKKYGSGNLSSFSGYKIIYEQLGQGIQDYNSSAMILGSGNSDDYKILNNRNIAYQFRFLIGAEGCVKGYSDYIKQFENILKQISTMITNFDDTISKLNSFQKGIKDDRFKDCLKNINKGLNESKINMQNLGLYIQSYKNKSSKQLSGLVLTPDKCISQIDADGEKINSASQQVSQGLQSFDQMMSQLGTVLNNKDEDGLSKICSGDSQSQGQDFNNDINNGMGKLDDVFGDKQQQQQQNGQSSDQQDGQGQQQDQQGDQKVQNSDDKQYNDIPQGYEKDLMQRLNDNSKSWIDQMNKLRGDQNYNVKNYINQLFQNFYGHDTDFTNQQFGTGMLYNNGY